VDERLSIAHFTSPVGPLVVCARADGVLYSLGFGGPDESRFLQALARRFPGMVPVETDDPGGTITILRRYFQGQLDALGTLRVDTGGTPFQRRVWSALRAIPVGRTLSYGALAAAIGAPQAVRAVGAANGANPVAIVVPCHRVIGSDGSLTGYGGGLERKRWLLAHEGVALPQQSPLSFTS